ncbi:MAG: hypothetical protein N2C12_15860 [Planctomycetales bacterium]
MVNSQLKVYHGPQEEISEPSPVTDAVSVRLGQILPLLTDAVKNDRTWLQDFADDEISISSDLHEVILAYQHFRRPSA